MKKRGLDIEREAVKLLEKKGYTAVRVAGSGAGTNRDLCDIIASKRYTPIHYGIEVKSSKQDLIFIKSEQIEELKRFCDCFCAIPVLCVKFTYLPFVFLPLRYLHKTPKGNYSVSREYVSCLKNRD